MLKQSKYDFVNFWFLIHRWKSNKKTKIYFSYFISAFLLVVSGWLSYEVNKIKEVQIDYKDCQEFSQCQLSFQLDQKMSKPIIFLNVQYLFQSHKKFIEGYSKKQLSGQAITIKQASTSCRSAYLNRHMNLDPTEFPPDEIANPCGLMAKFYPQDDYQFVTNQQTQEKIEVNKNVADPYFSKRFKKNKSQKQWLDVEDPRFINWMVMQQEKQQQKDIQKIMGEN